MIDGRSPGFPPEITTASAAPAEIRRGGWYFPAASAAQENCLGANPRIYERKKAGVTFADDPGDLPSECGRLAIDHGTPRDRMRNPIAIDEDVAAV